MLGRHRLNADGADRARATDRQFHHAVGARPADRRRAPERRDHLLGVRDAPQRRHVEVVGVRVRDEHSVEREQLLDRGRRDAPADVRDPLAQHGVGEDAHATKLDEQRRVTDVGELVQHASAVPTRRSWSAPRAACKRPRCATALYGSPIKSLTVKHEDKQLRLGLGPGSPLPPAPAGRRVVERRPGDESWLESLQVAQRRDRVAGPLRRA